MSDATRIRILCHSLSCVTKFVHDFAVMFTTPQCHSRGTITKIMLFLDFSSCCIKGKEQDVRSCARRVLDMENYEKYCKKEFLRCCNETFGSKGEFPVDLSPFCLHCYANITFKL